MTFTCPGYAPDQRYPWIYIYIIVFNMWLKKYLLWPRRDSNTQPSDLESDALPLRHGVLHTTPKWKIDYAIIVK